ncbi:helix-turn-helix domain-containing protein [Stackebrandtia nassauensis]|nr:helix-turn-helix domain-containing protein [Stackebrandtia nassauensis]
MEWSERPIGRRVAYWRQRRGMSQQVFADAIGKSKSWVDKVERGVRTLDKYSVLNEIADALAIDAQLLLGRDTPRRDDRYNCIDQLEVNSIRASLERYERLGRYLGAAALEPVSVSELRKSVKHAWFAFEGANYPVLARTLIELLKSAPIAEEHAPEHEKAEAAGLLTQVYQIASSVLRKLGEAQLSWLAADRAIGAAQRCDDPLLIGIATMRVGNALRSLGRHQAALDLNVQVAHGLMTEIGSAARAQPEALSVYGILLLQGAMAASLSGDTATTRDLLNSAGRAASRVGPGVNHYWTSFGPMNVELHRAASAVELGDGRLALQIHERLDRAELEGLVPERRAHHYLDLARGCAQIGEFDKAGRALVAADRNAPSEIRCRPIAHEVISDVLRRTRGSAPLPVRQLADRMGIAALCRSSR